jgi:hypothetical protein
MSLAHKLQSNSEKDAFAELSCNAALNNLIFHLTDMSSLYYIILNGWYLGQMGDYQTCNESAQNG